MHTILVVGSSIFEQWRDIAQVAPACRVVNRAVGGTTSAYWVENLTRVLAEESPDTVLLYCGSNDLNEGVSETQIVENLRQCGALLGGIPLVYFTIIKAPQKWGKWEQIDRLNAAIFAALPPGTRLIESNAVFFPENEPVWHLFTDDALHLTDAAYDALCAYAKPRLCLTL